MFKRAGHFARTYEVWRATTTRDQIGNLIYTWTKLADVPGRAYMASITDTFAAAKLIGKITWTFACAPDVDIKNGDQVRFDGRKLTVRAIGVTSSGQRLQSLCQEVQM